MSSCADVFIELLSTKNLPVCAVMCAGSSGLAAGVNSRVFWSSNNMLEATQQALKMLLAVMGFQADLNRKALIWCTCWQRRRRFKKRTIGQKVIGTCKQDSSHWFTHGRRFPRLLLNSTEARCFVSMDGQMASRTDVFLGAAKQELWCTCSQRRRRFKKRNIAEKVNGTCKQDFTCRNGLIAVPTVNKDFICCETTQQKIQVSGVDRKMCLKKEFYYCDSTLQKQGFNYLHCCDCSTVGQKRDEYRFQEENWLLKTCTKYELPVVWQMSAMLPETCQVYYQASSDNKAPLWKQHNKKLYCKTSSDSKAPEHATQYKKCQFANLDVDTE
ncbi:hypothetical protein DPMN_051778 [Dreissena polymorpha]|uniref:Uncharacterized protein n=1 Tax=Dreissena polymorpha TaxID=45954 RepID=A0A9D4CIG1_DREPO|nr:hypothetical protein DPMN_051778 [Dreissena polymorpha]